MHSINLRKIVQDILNDSRVQNQAGVMNDQGFNEASLFSAYSELIRIRVGGIQSGDVVTFTTDQLYQFCQFVGECAERGAQSMEIDNRKN